MSTLRSSLAKFLIATTLCLVANLYVIPLSTAACEGTRCTQEGTFYRWMDPSEKAVGTQNNMFMILGALSFHFEIDAASVKASKEGTACKLTFKLLRDGELAGMGAPFIGDPPITYKEGGDVEMITNGIATCPKKDLREHDKTAFDKARAGTEACNAAQPNMPPMKGNWSDAWMESKDFTCKTDSVNSGSCTITGDLNGPLTIGATSTVNRSNDNDWFEWAFTYTKTFAPAVMSSGFSGTMNSKDCTIAGVKTAATPTIIKTTASKITTSAGTSLTSTSSASGSTRTTTSGGSTTVTTGGSRTTTTTTDNDSSKSSGTKGGTSSDSTTSEPRSGQDSSDPKNSSSKSATGKESSEPTSDQSSSRPISKEIMEIPKLTMEKIPKDDSTIIRLETVNPKLFIWWIQFDLQQQMVRIPVDDSQLFIQIPRDQPYTIYRQSIEPDPFILRVPSPENLNTQIIREPSSETLFQQPIQPMPRYIYDQVPMTDRSNTVQPRPQNQARHSAAATVETLGQCTTENTSPCFRSEQQQRALNASSSSSSASTEASSSTSSSEAEQSTSVSSATATTSASSSTQGVRRADQSRKEEEESKSTLDQVLDLFFTKSSSSLHSAAPVITPPPATPQPPAIPSVKTESEKVLDLINDIRTSKGLNTLTSNPLLEQAATIHANELDARNELTHQSNDGLNSQGRIRKTGYFDVDMATCNCSGWNQAYGEILANGTTSADAVVDQWMNSTVHRNIMLSPDYRELGVGISGSTWVIDFGKMETY